MPLDPHAKAILDAMAGLDGPSILESTPEDQRAGYVAMAAMGVADEVASVEDRSIAGPGGEIGLRIYRPESDATAGAPGCLVFFHGGGWTIGDLDSHDPACRALCRRAGVVVVAVDYRLAPEHPYPAAIDDAEVAFDWVRAQADALGIDADRLAVAGDSAGGNLAAVVAQTRRGQVAFQLLIYPSVDNRLVEEAQVDQPSMVDNADGYLLTADHMRWFSNNYLGDQDRRLPRVSPLRGDVTGVAPAFIQTAEFDPLRDQGEVYAAHLTDAGVDARVTRYDGLIHAFFQLNGVIPAADAAVDDAAEAVKRALA